MIDEAIFPIHLKVGFVSSLPIYLRLHTRIIPGRNDKRVYFDVSRLLGRETTSRPNQGENKTQYHVFYGIFPIHHKHVTFLSVNKNMGPTLSTLKKAVDLSYGSNL